MTRYVPRGESQRRSRNDEREEGERIARGQVRENTPATRGRSAAREAISRRADSGRPLAQRRD